MEDVEVSERKGRVKVRLGKGGKERTVPLNTDARKALKAWLEVRPGEGERLFYGKGGQPLSERGVQYLVQRYGKRAGLEDVSPHNLRHTFGKTLVDSKVGLECVKELMGHERLETTLIYVTPSDEDLVRAVELAAWSDR